jgi:hypothetical protein
MGIVDAGERALSRRGFGRLLTGAVLARVCRAAADARDMVGIPRQAPRVRLERSYRADAAVLFCGVQIFHRENVGGGSVRWQEFDDPSVSGRLLEFTGFSLPQRAAGLNRVGFIREMHCFGPEGRDECAYFGVMTSSPEESAEEARKALHSTEKEQTYTAIQGRIAAGATETAIAHFRAPASVSGDCSAELVERAGTALADTATIAGADPSSGTVSFLQTLSHMLPRPDAQEGRYIYSGRAYRMRLARSADPKAAALFRERGLIGSAAEVVRVTGRVHREAGGKETEFRLWIPAGAARPMPLRIEYQPKSYLRLVFEAVSA